MESPVTVKHHCPSRLTVPQVITLNIDSRSWYRYHWQRHWTLPRTCTTTTRRLLNSQNHNVKSVIKDNKINHHWQLSIIDQPLTIQIHRWPWLWHAFWPQEDLPPWLDYDVEIWERFRMSKEENMQRHSMRGNGHFVQLIRRNHRWPQLLWFSPWRLQLV